MENEDIISSISRKIIEDEQLLQTAKAMYKTTNNRIAVDVISNRIKANKLKLAKIKEESTILPKITEIP